MNADKLTAAPWHAIRKTDTLHLQGAGEIGYSELVGPKGGRYRGVEFCFSDADAEFIAMARNAFDVQMRLGWWAVPGMDGKGRMSWKVETLDDNSDNVLEGKWWPDPFTALTEAEKLCGENVDGK